MDVLTMVFGLVLAIVGAHLLVDGGVAVARRFNIPTLVIGSTIVAFGTSMPEFTVNIHAAANGHTELALGNILGSNVFNICVIIGVVAILTPLAVSRDASAKDLPMCLLSAVMIGVCGNELYFDHIDFHELMLSHGIIFLCFFIIFMYYTVQEARSGSAEDEAPDLDEASADGSAPRELPPLKACIYMILGLVGLVYGGDRIVAGAQGVAQTFGLSTRVIGLLIVGPGTSLPELIAALVAARRKEADLVLGNVLGSNIFNVFFTMGVTSIVRPIPLDLALNFAVIENVGATLLLVFYAWFSRRRPIGRILGVVLLVAYVAYVSHMLAH